jgi:outer membrane protein OmpA-like peptidoglycan-associated protein
VRDERGSSPPAAPSAPGDDSLGTRAPGASASTAELTELRDLLFGTERRQLEELRRRLDTLEPTPEELAEHLPEAIALRAARDQKLVLALAPTIERSIRESVRRNPRDIAAAIFPVLGPAIRKAIAETMSTLVASINRAVEHSISPRGLRWRFEAWRTGVPFAEIVIKHALVYRVERVFLIHAETGLLLAHAPDDGGGDGDVISGMLTAIRDFVSDSFVPRSTGEIRQFSVADVNVLTETGPRAYLAAVVRGEAPASVRDRLETTLESIHLQWPTALANFDGDAAAFAETRPLLEDCLETVVATDRGRRRTGLARFAWLIPVLMVAGAIATLVVQSNRRWSRAIASLEQEPGIVVVKAERDWGRWRFAGLRDPLAAHPSALLAAAGADTADVEGRWEPYVSMQPPLVLTRARRLLDVPPGVSLDLSGDTLAASGAATRQWLDRASALAASLPGVGAFDLTGVAPVLSEALESRRAAAERHRVLFAIGSSALDSQGRTVLAAAAAALAALATAADAEGRTLAVQLIGRTDTIGSESANLDLGLRRANVARAALVAAGVPAERITVRSVGAADPLPAALGQDRAQINRSVSFAVTLPDDSTTAGGRSGGAR